MNMRSFMRAVISILVTYGAGFLGSIFIADAAGTWYDGITKPWFTPPNWVFLPVWLILYGLMALALWIIWMKDPNVKSLRGWVPLFFAHLLLNAAWSIFFFGFHAVFVAMLDIGLLVFAVFTLMMGAYEIDKRATYLLLPYFVWVLFAAILNVSIWYLN